MDVAYLGSELEKPVLRKVLTSYDAFGSMANVPDLPLDCRDSARPFVFSSTLMQVGLMTVYCAVPKRSSESMGETLDLKDCTGIFQDVCGWGRGRQKTGSRIRERKKD